MNLTETILSYWIIRNTIKKTVGWISASAIISNIRSVNLPRLLETQQPLKDVLSDLLPLFIAPHKWLQQTPFTIDGRSSNLQMMQHSLERYKSRLKPVKDLQSTSCTRVKAIYWIDQITGHRSDLKKQIAVVRKRSLLNWSRMQYRWKCQSPTKTFKVDYKITRKLRRHFTKEQT